MKKTLEVKETDDGDAFVELPPEVLEELGWNEHTLIHMELEGDNVLIKEKTVWGVEDFKENLEMILDDIRVNRTKHTIKDGNHFFKIGQ